MKWFRSYIGIAKHSFTVSSIVRVFVCGVDVRTRRRLAADYVLKDKDVVEIMTSK